MQVISKKMILCKNHNFVPNAELIEKNNIQKRIDFLEWLCFSSARNIISMMLSDRYDKYVF